MVVNRLKELGGSAAGLLVMLALMAIPILLLLGAAEFSVWALEYIPDIIGMAMLICIVLIPLAIIPASRGLAGTLFGLASMVFGACLWLYTLAFTYIEWGMFAVVLGVLLAGVGVLFTGILAAIFSATWGVLGNIAVLLGLSIGTRIVSSLLTSSADRRQLKKMAEETPSEVIITQPRRN